jgi:hypothetical protein
MEANEKVRQREVEEQLLRESEETERHREVHQKQQQELVDQEHARGVKEKERQREVEELQRMQEMEQKRQRQRQSPRNSQRQSEQPQQFAPRRQQTQQPQQFAPRQQQSQQAQGSDFQVDGLQPLEFSREQLSFIENSQQKIDLVKDQERINKLRNFKNENEYTYRGYLVHLRIGPEIAAFLCTFTCRPNYLPTNYLKFGVFVVF